MDEYVPFEGTIDKAATDEDLRPNQLDLTEYMASFKLLPMTADETQAIKLLNDAWAAALRKLDDDFMDEMRVAHPPFQARSGKHSADTKQCNVKFDAQMQGLRKGINARRNAGIKQPVWPYNEVGEYGPEAKGNNTSAVGRIPDAPTRPAGSQGLQGLGPETQHSSVT